VSNCGNPGTDTLSATGSARPRSAGSGGSRRSRHRRGVAVQVRPGRGAGLVRTAGTRRSPDRGLPAPRRRPQGGRRSGGRGRRPGVHSCAGIRPPRFGVGWCNAGRCACTALWPSARVGATCVGVVRRARTVPSSACWFGVRRAPNWVQRRVAVDARVVADDMVVGPVLLDAQRRRALMSTGSPIRVGTGTFLLIPGLWTDCASSRVMGSLLR